MTESFDIAIIGAGPGGYVAAIRCAQLGLKVACIEKRKELGGTCLNVGCIPSKALLQSSEYYDKAKKSFQSHGIEMQGLSYNLTQMMTRKQGILDSFNQGIAALFKKNKITHYNAQASFVDTHTLSLGEQQIAAKQIILATGSEPIPLPFLPFDEKRVLSSTGALSLTEVPKKLLIVGAGVIGVELGSVYNRLGSEVTFIEFLPKICPAFDDSLSKELFSSLQKQGMQFHLNTKVTAAKVSEKGVSLELSQEGKDTQTLEADTVLVAIGRKPYTKDLALDKAGIQPSDKGFIPINGSFQTSAPHIFAIGDIVDGPMLAHKASEEGVAVAELIKGLSPKVNYAAIPNVIYTHPEVASVGLTEQEAKQKGLSIKMGSFPLKANSRARCSAEEEGFVKVIIEETSERLIGVHIISAAASELIATAAIALANRLTLQDLLHTPFAHPTLAESIKEAALSIKNAAIHK